MNDKRPYVPLSLTGPLAPGEYRDLADGRFRVCCADCESILTTTTLVTLPDHGCTARQRKLRQNDQEQGR